MAVTRVATWEVRKALPLVKEGSRINRQISKNTRLRASPRKVRK